jgi:hypothetical protein
LIMKKTILTAVAILTLAAPLAWGGGDGCGSGCDRTPQQQEEQSVTGSTPQPTEQAAPKGRARGASIDDFVAHGRTVEKGCSAGDNCREPGKPQPEMRAPEKKCDQNPC